MSNNKEPTKVVIQKGSFLKNLFTNPFKYYRRAGGYTFCLTGLINIGTSLFDATNRKKMVDNPQFFTIGLVAKMSYFGILWPAFYGGLIFDKDRKDYVVMYRGINKVIDETQKKVDKFQEENNFFGTKITFGQNNKN